LLPSSGWMKPKPFWLLNHFTVPCVIQLFPSGTCALRPRLKHIRFIRDLKESRQSDAVCAVRPSRSAQARLLQNGALGFTPQGACPPYACQVLQGGHAHWILVERVEKPTDSTPLGCFVAIRLMLIRPGVGPGALPPHPSVRLGPRLLRRTHRSRC
jgi:hypothetical protein